MEGGSVSGARPGSDTSAMLIYGLESGDHSGYPDIA
jgi:hypothetical protein